MEFSKINELKPYDLNCNIFDVYSYNGLSMQELLCQFFTKINECVNTSNETIDLVEWLVNEGLKQEVAIKLTNWLNDGTLENLINVTLFENLNKKIDDVSSQLEQKANTTVINVKDFTAKGDGLNDDSLAINNAIEYASINNYSQVFIPKGTYLIGEPIKIKSNIHLFGEGETYIQLKQGAIIPHCITNSNHDLGNENIRLSNIKTKHTISLYSQNNYHPRGFISFVNVDNLEIDNLDLDFTVNQPVWLWKCNNVKIHNNKIVEKHLNGEGSGIWIMSSYQKDDIDKTFSNYEIYDNNIYASVDEGISIFTLYGRLENIKIYNNVIKSINTSSIGIVTLSSVESMKFNESISNVYINNNDLYEGGIFLSQGIKDIYIHENRIYRETSDNNLNYLIYMEESSKRICPTNIIIKNNDLKAKDISCSGINVFLCDNMIVDSNSFDGLLEGIKFSASNNQLGMLISNNLFTNCGTGVLSEHTRIVIDSNTFITCETSILLKSFGSDRALIKNNNFKLSSECIRVLAKITSRNLTINSNYFSSSKNYNIIIDKDTTADFSSRALIKDNIIEGENSKLITDETSDIKRYFILFSNLFFSKESWTWIECEQ